MPPMSSSTISAITLTSCTTFSPFNRPSSIAFNTPLAPASKVRPASPSPAIWSCSVSSGSAAIRALHARAIAARKPFASVAVYSNQYTSRFQSHYLQGKTALSFCTGIGASSAFTSSVPGSLPACHFQPGALAGVSRYSRISLAE